MLLTDLVTTSKETFMEERIPNFYKFCAPTQVSSTIKITLYQKILG